MGICAVRPSKILNQSTALNQVYNTYTVLCAVFNGNTMYDPILSQVIFDANEYQKRINYIEKAKKDLPNWRGKPKYNVIFESVDVWERDIMKIKKTIIPA